jgi:hypothetical protein
MSGLSDKARRYTIWLINRPDRIYRRNRREAVFLFQSYRQQVWRTGIEFIGRTRGGPGVQLRKGQRLKKSK